MRKIKYISSGAEWESEFGYSRALRHGHTIEFSGTVSPDRSAMGEYEQTKSILELIGSYLEKEGGTRSDIVRTRVYCLHIDRWKEIARAHAEFFKDHKPATSLLEISGLIDPHYLVEIEAVAVLHE